MKYRLNKKKFNEKNLQIESHRRRIYISALQQGFRRTCSGLQWVSKVPWGFLVF